MTVKKKYRLLVASLAMLIVLLTVGLFLYRADWTFRAMNLLRIYPTFKPEAIALETQSFSADALLLRGETIGNELMLVNASHPLPENYQPLLEEYHGARMHPGMVAAYASLRDDIQQKTDQRLYVSSDYRTPEEQADVLLSSPEGIAAQVGFSEHEAGLALDVYVKGYGGMSLIKTEAGRLLAECCADYGFIIRYPEGKEEITGTPYEPWHIRYVGAPHAKVISSYGLTYEEYLEALTPGVWYKLEDYLVGRFSIDAVEIPTDPSLSYSLSYDNTGYCIVTVKPS